MNLNSLGLHGFQMYFLEQFYVSTFKSIEENRIVLTIGFCLCEPKSLKQYSLLWKYTLKSLIIHEPKTKKVSSVDDVWKSEEEITETRPTFTSIFSRNTG